MTVKILSGSQVSSSGAMKPEAGTDSGIIHNNPDINTDKPYVYSPERDSEKQSRVGKTNGTVNISPKNTDKDDSAQQSSEKPKYFTGEVNRVRPRTQRHGLFFTLLAQLVICAAVAAAVWAAAGTGGDQTAEICMDITELFRLK